MALLIYKTRKGLADTLCSSALEAQNVVNWPIGPSQPNCNPCMAPGDGGIVCTKCCCSCFAIKWPGMSVPGGTNCTIDGFADYDPTVAQLIPLTDIRSNCTPLYFFYDNGTYTHGSGYLTTSCVWGINPTTAGSQFVFGLFPDGNCPNPVWLQSSCDVLFTMNPHTFPVGNCHYGGGNRSLYARYTGGAFNCSGPNTLSLHVVFSECADDTGPTVGRLGCTGNVVSTSFPPTIQIVPYDCASSSSSSSSSGG